MERNEVGEAAPSHAALGKMIHGGGRCASRALRPNFTDTPQRTFKP